MDRQTVHIESVEEILAAVKAAEASVSAGRDKARRAKALVGQMERMEKDVAQAGAQAEREMATAQEALAQAESLRPVLGEEFVAGAQAVVKRLEQQWSSRIAEAQARVGAAKAELRALDEDPDLEAFMTLDEARRRERAVQREAHRRGFERRLATLRPGCLIGQGEEALRRLAGEAREAGFESLSAEATASADRAATFRAAREVADADRRRRAFMRWCKRHSSGGHLVLVSSWDERQAAQLRPRPAASGRLYFEVVATTGGSDAPAKYDDLPAHTRTWRARGWAAPEGFSPDQAQMLEQLASGIAAREANALNAGLARKVQAARAARAEATPEPEPPSPEAVTEAPAAPDPEVLPSEGNLAGLPAAAVARLGKAGLTTREAVAEAASDEATFLALPGIGAATLAAVQEWLVEEAGVQAEGTAQEAEKAPEEEVVPQGAQEQEEEDVEPEIIVVGLTMDGDMPGTRLAQWRGMARTLAPLLRTGRVGRLELLVEETHNGDGPEVGILAAWEGHALEIAVPGSGDRSCRTAAMQQLVQELRVAYTV